MIQDKKQFKKFDDRGALVPIEFTDIPFIPKRIFWIVDTPKNAVRGCHAHYVTKQFYICLKGTIQIELTDGIKEKIVLLTEAEGILIDKLVWGMQTYLTGKDVGVVLCSTSYDANDYIYDYNNFLKIKANK